MRYKHWTRRALIFAGGLACGWLAAQQFGDLPNFFEIHEGQRSFVNPLLECESGDVISQRELVPFKPSIVKLVQEEKKRKKITNISVYFRDLNNGPWFGIDEKAPFIPASLMKVPILMAYLKQAETDPSVLQRKLRAYGAADANEGENIRPRIVVEAGKTYSVEQLLSMMVLYSENNAARLLGDNDGGEYFGNVLADLGLPAPDPAKPEYAITVKTYASFFRILFNASYLNQERSNQALELLSRVDFHGGIRAGVPQPVVVAHKFGERSQGREMQFHDCGIVYYPEHPYLLCIMTRGEGLAELVDTTQDISYQVFAEVDRQAGRNAGKTAARVR